MADEAEMRAGVDSLLGRIAEFAPMDAEEAETLAEAGVAAEEQRGMEAEAAAIVRHRRKKRRSKRQVRRLRRSPFELRSRGWIA